LARIRVIHVEASGLAPFVEGLRRLERDILYPIGDGADHFRIDHGPEYAPFFSGLGEAHFAIALDGDEVVGNAVGVIKRARLQEREIVSGYACDYKVDKEHRGRGVGRALLMLGLREMLRNAHYRSWRFGFGAAMRGEKGDVLRSGRGFHPLKLMKPFARLHVYFVAPSALAELPEQGGPGPVDLDRGLDLSPEVQERSPTGIASSAGKKDLRLVSTGEPWPLEHLVHGPARWRPSFSAHLRSCGRALVDRGARGPVCFSLDTRLAEHVSWLERHGLEPGASCAIIAWRLPPRIPRPAWIHLATVEI
jgi:hypothetical protein